MAQHANDSPLESFLNCYQQWCDENEYVLYKLNKHDKTLEKVTLSELQTLLTTITPPIDNFMDRFFECWTTHHWTMMTSPPIPLRPPSPISPLSSPISKLFDLYEFEEEMRILYRNKTSLETCVGCLEDQPNQLAHMGPGGCLYYSSDDE